MLVRSSFAFLTVLASALLGGLSPALAQDPVAQDPPTQNVWRISKSSGDVSVSTEGMQLVTLTNGMALQPGDAIRTGQNGRVLLTRGNETILISANSAISIPKKDSKDGLATTILQQAGSILLEVEKRGVKHFEVETPHLSAVVKGTRFHVTINADDTRVGVFRGQVEVTDFRSGQHTLVNAGQSASASVQGPAGLSVSGSGLFSPIQQGTPRPSSTPPVVGPGQSVSQPPSPAGTGQGLSPLPSPTAPAAIQRQARTPLLGEIQTVALPERDAAQRDGWGPGLTALGERALSGKGDIDTLSLAFPFAIGAVVAMTMAVRRRRQQRKLTQASGQ
jgi:hypothetical protein